MLVAQGADKTMETLWLGDLHLIGRHVPQASMHEVRRVQVLSSGLVSKDAVAASSADGRFEAFRPSGNGRPHDFIPQI
jgi:hypothetical protein